jgi:hypothetical protein
MLFLRNTDMRTTRRAHKKNYVAITRRRDGACAQPLHAKSVSIERIGERAMDTYSAALARQGSRQRAHPTPGPHTTVKWTPLSRGGNYTSKTVLRQCCKMPAFANFRRNGGSIAMKSFSFPHRTFAGATTRKKGGEAFPSRTNNPPSPFSWSLHTTSQFGDEHDQAAWINRVATAS